MNATVKRGGSKGRRKYPSDERLVGRIYSEELGMLRDVWVQIGGEAGRVLRGGIEATQSLRENLERFWERAKQVLV
jgi:hypothetical protein